MRREDRSSIVVSSSRRPRRVRGYWLRHRWLSLLRAVPLFVPSGRSFVPACGYAGAPRAGAVAMSSPLALAFPGHALTVLSTARGSNRLGRIGLDALEGASLVENRPGDAGELVGERDRQHVAVQALLGRFDPRFEPVALPSLWLDLDQHDPGGLNEQRA